MARVSTFDARESLLRELKEQQAIIRDKPTKVAALTKQLDIAEKASFPKSAIDALNGELSRVQKLGGDDSLDRKIEMIARWITVERDYQAMFGKPEKKTRVAKSDGIPKKRGRPAKGK